MLSRNTIVRIQPVLDPGIVCYAIHSSGLSEFRLQITNVHVTSNRLD